MGSTPGSTGSSGIGEGSERYGEALTRHGEGRWLPAALAEAGRRTAASVAVADERERAMLDVTAGVAGPCLVAYVGWVLATAREGAIDRLYFVAREGEVLLRIGRALQDRVGAAPATELRYLHGSRAAWQLPAVGLADGRVVEWLLADAQETTLADLVGRMGIPLDEAVRTAAGIPADRLGGNERLHGLAAEVRRNLLRSQEFRARLAARAAEARAVTLAYLEQERVLAPGAVGLVDTGWSGRQFQAFELLTRPHRPHPPSKYLLYAIVKTGAIAPERTRCFVADARRQPFVEAEAARFGELIESFCAGRQGATVGYERRGDEVVPVLSQPRNEPALAWGLDRYREQLDVYLDHACDLLAGRGFPDAQTFDACVPGLEAVLEELWYRPTPAEARTWGSLRDADHGSTDWDTRAPRVGWGDLIPWATNRRWVRWPHAVAATSTQPLATAIRLLAALLRLAVRVRALIRALRR